MAKRSYKIINKKRRKKYFLAKINFEKHPVTAEIKGLSK